MDKLDLINSFFYFGMGITQWTNVYRLWKDKRVLGVSWTMMVWSAIWCLFDALVYYPSLHQWNTTVACINLGTATTTWGVLYFYYTKVRK